MPFGARQIEDKTWRLCQRKGPTFTHLNTKFWPDIEIVFKSQAKAKACADEMNVGWLDYKSYESKKTEDPEVFWQFLEALKKHGGISGDDFQRIETDCIKANA